MGFGSFLKRAAVGVSTGGLSEVARYAQKKGALDTAKDALGIGKSSYSGADIDKTAFQKKLADDANQKQVRTQQQAQTTRLQSQADGTAPSIAEAQMKATTNRSLAQQLGAAQAQRGGSAASRERALMKSQGTARREVAESSVAAKLAERQQAETALAGQLSNQRTQDIGVSQADIASGQDLEKLKVQNTLGVAGINQASTSATNAARGNMLSNLSSGAMAMFSDKNCKKNIEKEGNKEENKKENLNPKSFLDKLQAYSYEYKNEFKDNKQAGPGRHLSVMAQDLEKAGPVGKNMVDEVDGTKQINYGKGFAGILAAQAHLNQRLSELETKKKK